MMRCFLAALALMTTALPAVLSAQSVTINNVTIVDVVHGRLARGMTVVVDGKRIASISRTRAGVTPHGEWLDGTGRYLIPGLWDMHVHTFFTNDSSRFHTSSELYLPLFIVNGITGVRDMGSNLDAVLAARDSIAAHQLVGPRMVVAGPMLDGPTSPYQVIARVATPDDGRAAAKMLHDRGVDLIKVQSKVARVAYFGIADETERLGMQFEGHVPDAIRASEAIDAHQRSFEHSLGVFIASTTREDSFVAGSSRTHAAILASRSEPREQAIVAALAQHHVWQCPTLASDLNGPFDVSQDPGLPYMPRSIVARWNRTALRKLNSTDSVTRDVDQRFGAFELDLIRRLHQAGVPFLAGTDAPAGFDLVPGASLHHELEWLAADGFTPREALQTATINPATFLGRTNELGTVAVGKLADLVILARDPLTAIGNTRSVVAVIAGGRYYAPEELNRMRLRLMGLAAKW